MKFKQDEIIFLVGAGISADAGVPVSSKMVEDVEKLVNTEWSRFKDLYFLVKSGVEFSYGIQGKRPIFNIEVLVNILNELEKKEMHPLYPFIGSWHIKFNEVIGNNFNLIKEFRESIIEQLKSWVNPSDLRKADYLKKLSYLKAEINFPLRIFSLNYDLLLEKKLEEEALTIERGFEEDTREWNYKRFTELSEEPDIYLYKLHGSIDWERNRETQVVRYIDSIPREPDLIFGTQYKMQYIDPYLFMISEFRHYCLKAKLIVCLGYSFSDEHVNSILSQSLLKNNVVKMHILAYNEEEEKIKNILKCSTDRLNIITNKKAKEYFEEDLKLDTFLGLFTEDESENII
ncbi:MAG: SIR2 family protein [Candidatus Micrarchaeia archaeon]